MIPFVQEVYQRQEVYQSTEYTVHSLNKQLDLSLFVSFLL